MMSKISDQLLLHPVPNGLTMSAFNATRSAYAKVAFSEAFFENCNVPDDVIAAAETNQYCRIGIKSALNIFKTSNAILQCTLELDPEVYSVRYGDFSLQI